MRRQVHYVEVTPISRLAAREPRLLAEDGLHPSAAMYALWVQKILAQVCAEDF